MSRVAAIIVVGLCFLAGCREISEPIKIAASNETKPKIKEPDIIYLPDPNDLADLEKTLDGLVPMENQFFIIPVEPRPGVDYKIIASKPNPNIDYKILTPDRNSEKLLRELQRQIDKDNHKKIQENQSRPTKPNMLP